jgi:hypothetical protein
MSGRCTPPSTVTLCKSSSEAEPDCWYTIPPSLAQVPPPKNTPPPPPTCSPARACAWSLNSTNPKPRDFPPVCPPGSVRSASRRIFTCGGVGGGGGRGDRGGWGNGCQLRWAEVASAASVPLVATCGQFRLPGCHLALHFARITAQHTRSRASYIVQD